MSDWLRLFLGAAIWFFVLGVALWRGGGPERLVAAVRLVAILVSPAVNHGLKINGADVNVMLVDAVVLAVMLGVSLRSDRWWPIFCTGFFLVAFSVHLVKMSRPDTSFFVYASASIIFAYLALAAQAAGIIELELRRWRERRPPLSPAH